MNELMKIFGQVASPQVFDQIKIAIASPERIRSWSFYSGGGFGEAAWSKDGNKWALKTTARTAGGKNVSATNVLTRIDDDHMTWQMTELTVDGKSLPAPAPVKLKRVRPPQP